jgi:hypothetical protein
MAHPAATKRELPLGDALAPTIDRLRDIATASYDTLLLAEGPPQPDYALLDLCSETLHTIKKANEASAARPSLESCNQSPKARAEWQAAFDAWQDADREATRLLRRVSKMRATTAAGLYAKALVCRSSASGSAALAHSLADDFIACDGLRASLWPAESGEEG